MTQYCQSLCCCIGIIKSAETTYMKEAFLFSSCMLIYLTNLIQTSLWISQEFHPKMKLSTQTYLLLVWKTSKRHLVIQQNDAGLNSGFIPSDSSKQSYISSWQKRLFIKLLKLDLAYQYQVMTVLGNNSLCLISWCFVSAHIQYTLQSSRRTFNINTVLCIYTYI